jgi:hypothetical protein
MENTRMRENCEPITLDLILTNDENMIEELNYTSPLGNSDHCSLEFVLKCYCGDKSCKTERWNYFKEEEVRRSKNTVNSQVLTETNVIKVMDFNGIQ